MIPFEGRDPRDVALALVCLPFVVTIYACAAVVDAINELGEKL